MKLTHEDYEQLSVFSLRGDLNAEATEEFLTAAKGCMGRNIRDFVLDLGGMEFIDSKGLEALLWLQEQATDRMGQVRLAAATENVRKILEITRLAPRFDRHPDTEAAIKSLR